jgi:hypothetical protein
MEGDEVARRLRRQDNTKTTGFRLTIVPEDMACRRTSTLIVGRPESFTLTP